MALVRNPITGVWEENGLGLPAAAPVVTSGYSSNPVVARAQANTDAEAQAMAVHRARIQDANLLQPGVTSGYSDNMYTANAQAAADLRKQEEAVAAANRSPQLLGPNGLPQVAPTQGAAPTLPAGPRGLGVQLEPGATAGVGGPRGLGAVLPVPADTPTSMGLPGLATPSYPGVAQLPSYPEPAPAPVAAPAASPGVVAPAPAPTGLRTAEDLAATNAALAQGINRPQAPAVAAPAALGAGLNTFDQTNTVTTGSRGPANNGIDLGFGGGRSATQYLQDMAAQDRQGRLDQRAQAAVLEQRSLVAHINDPFTSPTDKRYLLRQLQLGAQGQEQAAGLATQFAGGTQQARAQQAAAQIQQQTAATNARLAADTRLQEASIQGQYGLQAAKVKVAGAQETAKQTSQNTAGTQRNAVAEAQLKEQRLAIAQAQFNIDGDADKFLAATRDSAPTVPRPAIDLTTGAPLAADVILAQQELQRRAAAAQLARNQK